MTLGDSPYTWYSITVDGAQGQGGLPREDPNPALQREGHTAPEG